MEIVSSINNNFNTINDFIEKLKNEGIGDKQDLENFIDRFNDIFIYYNNKINKINYNLIIKSDLNNLNNYLSNITNYLKNYNNTKNSNYIVNSNSTLDSFLKIFNTFPIVNKEETKGNLNQIISGFKRSFDNISNKIKEKEKSFIAEINDYKTKLEYLEKEKNNLEEKIKKQEEIISNHIVNLNEKFTESQNLRNQSYSKELKDFVNSAKETIELQLDKFLNIESEEKEKLDTFFDKKNTEVSVILAEMEKSKEKVKELLGIVGKDTFAGNYTKYANAAKKFSNILFWSAFGLMMLSALIFIIPISIEIFDTFKNDKEVNVYFWKNLLYRLPISFIILLPSFYLSIEAKKQREKENKYRDFEIKISALSPYMIEINDNDITEKDKVKLELAKKFFGETYQEKEENNIIIPNELIVLIERILSKIKIGGK